MKGKWIFVAFAASFGTMAAFFHFHWIVITASVIFLVWVSLKESPSLNLFIICMSAMCIFAFFYKWTDDHNETKLSGMENELAGIIQTIPVIDGDRLSFTFQLHTKEKVNLSYIIKTSEEKDWLQQLQVGMSCKLSGKLETPNPARNFYGFNYQQFLHYKRIHWIFTPDSFRPLDCQSSSSMKFLLQKWRASELTYIKEHFPENSIGFVQALIFGDRQEISPTIEEDFQQFGLVHLLAISGSHVVLMVAVIFYIFVRLGLTREKAFLLLIVLLPFYMVLAGGSPSVVRACLAALLVLGAMQFKLRFHPLDALSFVFLLMILVEPYYITDIGFQLSFLVSFSLIVSAYTIMKIYESYWQQLFIVTMIAQISSLPLVLLYNFEISLVSLPLNLIFVPLVSIIILPVSIVSLFILYVSKTLAIIPLSILSTIIDFSIKILDLTKNLSTFALAFGKPEEWLLLVYYVVIIYFFISWEKHKRMLKAKRALLLLLLVFVYHWFSPYISNEGKVTMIDVGQGDSILIELPFRKAVYLIDTGGIVNFSEKKEWQQRKKKFEVGEDIITPLLKAKGIRSIDKLILTHGDLDHIGGTEAVLNHFNVKEIITNNKKNESSKSKEEIQLYRLMDEKNIPIKEVKTGDFWKNGDFTFYILGPIGNEDSQNNQSIVLYTTLGGKRWLFTGDLEKEGESQLLRRFPNLQTDFIKIGHHGSNTSTSTAFLEQLNPKLALISVGKNNRFGHPHPEVIGTLHDHQIGILRTDKNGAICYQFIGNKGTFEWKLP
ncbi:DNA internalization-related competence protein ComEC/Rec2 [Schinkia sp. CFF1]